MLITKFNLYYTESHRIIWYHGITQGMGITVVRPTYWKSIVNAHELNGRAEQWIQPAFDRCNKTCTSSWLANFKEDAACEGLTGILRRDIP